MPVGNGTVLIGMGERTTPQAVEPLARALFAQGAAERVIAARDAARPSPSCIWTPCSPSATAISSPCYPPVVERIRAISSLRPGDKDGQLTSVARSKPFSRWSAECAGPEEAPRHRHRRRQLRGRTRAVGRRQQRRRARARRRRRLRPQRLHQHPAAQGRDRGHHHRGLRTRPRPGRRPLHDLPAAARSHLTTQKDEDPDEPSICADRSFLTLHDFTPAEIGYLLQLSADLKAAKYAGTEQPRACQGKNIALIFEKDSTRTRWASRSRPTTRAPRHLHRPDRLAHRPQGDDEGHGPRARPHVRRHRVPRLRPGDRRGAGRATPACRSTTASPTSSTRPRCSPTS